MSELIKRTFHVEISSDVLEMIREVEQPFFSSGGAYYRLEKYLCEQDHPDARFFLNDPTICEYEKLLKENGRKYDSYVRKELNKAYKQRNLKRTELRRESELLTKKWRLYQKTASEATHLTKKQRSKLRMEPGGAEDMRLKKNANLLGLALTSLLQKKTHLKRNIMFYQCSPILAASFIWVMCVIIQLVM